MIQLNNQLQVQSCYDTNRFKNPHLIHLSVISCANPMHLLLSNFLSVLCSGCVALRASQQPGLISNAPDSTPGTPQAEAQAQPGTYGYRGSARTSEPRSQPKAKATPRGPFNFNSQSSHSGSRVLQAGIPGVPTSSRNMGGNPPSQRIRNINQPRRQQGQARPAPGFSSNVRRSETAPAG